MMLMFPLHYRSCQRVQQPHGQMLVSIVSYGSALCLLCMRFPILSSWLLSSFDYFHVDRQTSCLISLSLDSSLKHHSENCHWRLPEIVDLRCLRSCCCRPLSHVITVLSDDVQYFNARRFHLQPQLLQSHNAHLSLSTSDAVYPLRHALLYDACYPCSMPIHSGHSYSICHLSRYLSPVCG